MTYDEFLKTPPGTVACWGGAKLITLVRGSRGSVFYINSSGDLEPADAKWKQHTFTLHDMVAEIKVTYKDAPVLLGNAKPGWHKDADGNLYFKGASRTVKFSAESGEFSINPSRYTQVTPAEEPEFTREQVKRAKEGLWFQGAGTDLFYGKVGGVALYISPKGIHDNPGYSSAKYRLTDKFFTYKLEDSQ